METKLTRIAQIAKERPKVNISFWMSRDHGELQNRNIHSARGKSFFFKQKNVFN